jgi:Ca2+-binding RTX toxin-like protein
MVGGQGADVFVFNNLGGLYEDNKDTIKDFEVGVDTFIV